MAEGSAIEPLTQQDLCPQWRNREGWLGGMSTRLDRRAYCRHRYFVMKDRGQGLTQQERFEARMETGVDLDQFPGVVIPLAVVFGYTVLMDDLERREVVRKLMAALPWHVRRIVILRFGLEGEDPYTLTECGRIFKLGPDRIRQIEARGLKLMLVRHREFRIGEGKVGRG